MRADVELAAAGVEREGPRARLVDGVEGDRVPGVDDAAARVEVAGPRAPVGPERVGHERARLAPAHGAAPRVDGQRDRRAPVPVPAAI